MYFVVVCCVSTVFIHTASLCSTTRAPHRHKLETGSAELPADYSDPDNAQLTQAARWLARQRELYNRQKLDPVRLRLLKDVLGACAVLCLVWYSAIQAPHNAVGAAFLCTLLLLSLHGQTEIKLSRPYAPNRVRRRSFLTEISL